MKRIIFMLAFLTLVSCSAFAQAGHAGQEKNLQGLKGVRLVVMFAHKPDIDEPERAGVLKLVEADATERLQKAHIPVFRFINETEEAGSPQLIVYITADKPNGFNPAIATRVTLLQRVRLSRDPTIEDNLATWEVFGVGGPLLSVPVIRQLTAQHIDQFVRDYLAANPQ
jgi:hypothetical protein